MKNGFTIIELIIVVSFITILAGMATPFASSFVSRNNWHVAADRVQSETWKAQSYAMEGKAVSGDSVWGVCISGPYFRLFNGSCATPNLSEDYLIPTGVTITGITTLTFANLRGEPSTPSTITISSTYGTSTITLNAAGMIQQN